MNDNKFGKYLLYALGEILLVVIGILIALQVNNYNEQKRTLKKEQNLFSNLRIDFNSRLQELKEFNASREISISAILELNRIIADPLNRPSEEKMDSLISKTLYGFKFNEEFKMLDVMFNTGLINDIKNENLKRAFIEWPQKIEEMLEEQRIHDAYTLEEYIPLLAKHVSLRDIYEKYELRQYNIPKNEPVTLVKNYGALFKEPSFENDLVILELLIRINYIDTETLISSAEEIIEMLNNELDR